MSREVEAKLEIADPAAFERAKTLREIAGFSIAGGKEVFVHDSYWDTEGRALRGAGWALRCRESGGRVILTLKSLETAAGPVQEREELEAEIERFSQPRQWPQCDLAQRVLSSVGDAALVPLFEVDQRRLVRSMNRGERTAAEMSLDRVTIRAGDREREYGVLEIELLPGGTREDLSEMLAAMREKLPSVPSPRSKFEEGMLLLEEGAARFPPKGQTLSGRPRGAPRSVLLDAPTGISEQRILAELRRLGYRPLLRSRKEESRTYFDTQGGNLFRQGRELYFSAGDTRWHLGRGGMPERSQKGKGNAPPDTGPLGRALHILASAVPRVPYLNAFLRETRFSLSSVPSSGIALAVQRWLLRSPLHKGPEQVAFALAIDRGTTPRFHLDYFIGLLSKSLDLRAREGTFLELALTRLDAPLPGAPLPRLFVPAAGDDAAAVCAKVLAGESWRMKANTPGAILDLDPEFVHDVRVATRRARFACRLFAATLGAEGRDRIRAELAWIADLLGGVRDLDILHSRLCHQRSPAEANLFSAREIEGLLNVRREKARENLRAALDSQRYTALLDLMAAAGGAGASRVPSREARTPSEPVDRFARKRIGKALRRIAPWTERSAGELSPAELHRIRILFKRLRYTAEFFRPILGMEVAALIKECVAYQDCLGVYQDARMALDVLGGLADEPSLRESARGLFTLGALVQAQRDFMDAQKERFGTLWRSSSRLFELWAPRRPSRREAR
jgi:inorganic triphosphatase YgiF